MKRKKLNIFILRTFNQSNKKNEKSKIIKMKIIIFSKINELNEIRKKGRFKKLQC